jgi:cephalosporin hydroxylase
MGRPIIQIPEDMIRVSDLIKPMSIIEQEIHGLMYASLCKAMRGRVIGIDIDIRPKIASNRNS